MTDNEDEQFLSRVRANLDAAEEQLDGATRTRLAAIRREAVQQGQGGSWREWLVPVGGLAAVATVAALSINLWMAPPPGEETAFPLEDMALLSDSEGPEFYENLEFYQWLENEEQQAG